MGHDHHTIIESIYRRHHQAIASWLQSRFAGASHAQVQDAVADAFTEALERPRAFVRAWRRGGDDDLLRLLRRVAWRRLRAHWRKKSTQCELLHPGLGHDAEPSHWDTPLAAMQGRRDIARLLALIEEAAQQFGGGRRLALGSALRARLEGATDAEVARAHGVPREYVNRAKRWIGVRLWA